MRVTILELELPDTIVGCAVDYFNGNCTVIISKIRESESMEIDNKEVDT